MAWMLWENDNELCEISSLKRERGAGPDGTDQFHFQAPATTTIDVDQAHRLVNSELGVDMGIKIEQALRNFPSPLRITAHIKR